MRKPLICGNWKMNKSVEEARQFASELARSVKRLEGVDVVVCPPYTALQEVGKLVDGIPVGLGAQDIAWDKEGAFTGEISPLMLKEIGCTVSIVGHSERRTLLEETNEIVNRKLKNALKFNMTPILCVGESLDEHEAGRTQEVVASQLEGSLEGVKEISGVVLAYEPIWAIGTGKTATPETAQEVHVFIRKRVKEAYGESAAQRILILYGGSVHAKNTAALLAQPDIDGALVGGASLEVRSFVEIIEAAQQAAEKV